MADITFTSVVPRVTVTRATRSSQAAVERMTAISVTRNTEAPLPNPALQPGHVVAVVGIPGRDGPPGPPGPGGGGPADDPGDLTLWFDNALI